MEEYMNATQMAQELELAENTVRRYLRLFKDYIPARQEGRMTKYSPVALQIVAQIGSWYKEGLTTHDITRRLREAHTRVIDVAADPPQLDRVVEHLQRLEERLEKQQTFIEESLKQRDQMLMAAIREMMESKKQIAAAEEKQEKKWWQWWK